MSRLSQYFFKSLPDYFYYYDTYKDGQDKGLLERYMDVIQEDAEITDSDITGLGNLPFPLSTEDNYLNNIAAFYGYPPDTYANLDWYRNVLRNITDINKVKGSIKGFERFFGCMGASLTITSTEEHFINYDDGQLYDDSHTYDGHCFPCSYLTIVVDTTFAPFEGPIDDAFKLATQSIFLYLFPINAILSKLDYNGGSISLDLGAKNLIKMI